MEAGPPNTVEDLEDLSKRWLLERFYEDIHRLSRHLRELEGSRVPNPIRRLIFVPFVMNKMS